MKKIEIVSLLSESKELVDFLQRKGVVELSDYEGEQVEKFSTQSNVMQFEKMYNIVSEAKDTLFKYAPKKTGLIDSFCEKDAVDIEEFEKQAQNVEIYMKSCYRINELSKMISDKHSEIVRMKARLDAVIPWEALDVPMQYSGTKHTSAIIGTVPKWYDEETLEAEIALQTNADCPVKIKIISAYADQSCIFVMCHKDDYNQVLDGLREIEFTFPSDPTRHPPSVRIERLKQAIKDAENAIKDAEEEIKGFSGTEEQMEFLLDYYSMRKERYSVLGDLAITQSTVIITGFVPLKFTDDIVKKTQDKFTASVTLSDPDEDDDVPVLLENNGFVSPVEPITEMYALPDKQDVDPNPVMAFFYYLFFGMMLSDAGYGVVMTLFSAIALKKLNLKEGMRKTLKMFFFCGISTIFWGALFGSWFGDIIPVIYENFLGGAPDSLNLALWMDPVKDPMTLLLFSFVLGIVHLFTGLAVHFSMLWKEGKRWDAFCDVVPVYLTVGGAAPLAGSVVASIPSAVLNVAKYIAIIGVILVVLTAGRSSKNIFARLGGGLYGLYNVASGYLSDILSYSRLLALGLSTGIIAGVVNMMGTLPSSTAVKAVMLVVVFVFGHALNMAINLLGAYVHTNRLQYVEMFSKFYEGGGRAFAPLNMGTKYIKFKEEQ